MRAGFFCCSAALPIACSACMLLCCSSALQALLFWRSPALSLWSLAPCCAAVSPRCFSSASVPGPLLVCCSVGLLPSCCVALLLCCFDCCLSLLLLLLLPLSLPLLLLALGPLLVCCFAGLLPSCCDALLLCCFACCLSLLPLLLLPLSQPLLLRREKKSCMAWDSVFSCSPATAAFGTRSLKDRGRPKTRIAHEPGLAMTSGCKKPASREDLRIHNASQ